MKKSMIGLLILLLSFSFFVGCQKKEEPKEPKEPTTDGEIMEKLSPYLENAVETDISTPELLMANLGLDQGTKPVLYLGMPKQNTTFFAMLTVDENCDKQQIVQQLTLILDGWVESAKQGYIIGNVDYEVLEVGNRVFALMHEEKEKLVEMRDYIEKIN